MPLSALSSRRISHSRARPLPPRGDVLLNRSYVGASFAARCQRLHRIGAQRVRQDIAGDGWYCDNQSVGESFDTSEGRRMKSTASRRGDHIDLSLAQLADRLAIRELIDAYAYCADRRDAAGQMALFTEDTDFQVYMDSNTPSPTQHLRGRAALAPVFDELNTYVATMHFNGQSTTVLNGDHASGVKYCLAHHVKVDGSARSLMTAAIRYLDAFIKH